jgi:hypothetical protein
MNKSIVLSVCFALLFIFNIDVQAQTNDKLYAIICGGTKIVDIGSGVQASVKMMRKSVKIIAENTGLELVEILVLGDDFTKKNIINALDKVNPSSNDVILFYSSSHGSNYTDKPSEYTFFLAKPYTNVISSVNELHQVSVSLEFDVYDILKNKGARLTIAMAEACNTINGFEAPPNYKKMETAQVTRLKELFLETSGSVISCSSEYGTYSYTDLEKGGFYTNKFLTALNEVLASSETATWERVMNLTGVKTNNYAIKRGEVGQNPKSGVATPVILLNEKEQQEKAKSSDHYKSTNLTDETEPSKSNSEDLFEPETGKEDENE